MIRLTRLNDLPIVINPELIEFVEANPDTLVTLTTGHKFMVRETVDEVIDQFIAYKRLIAAGSDFIRPGRSGRSSGD